MMITAKAITFLYPSVEIGGSFRYDAFDVDASMFDGCVDSPLTNEHRS